MFFEDELSQDILSNAIFESEERTKEIEERIKSKKAEIEIAISSRDESLRDLDRQSEELQRTLDSKIVELRREADSKIAVLDSMALLRDDRIRDMQAIIEGNQAELDRWALKTERLLVEFAKIQDKITSSLKAATNFDDPQLKRASSQTA